MRRVVLVGLSETATSSCFARAKRRSDVGLVAFLQKRRPFVGIFPKDACERKQLVLYYGLAVDELLGCQNNGTQHDMVRQSEFAETFSNEYLNHVSLTVTSFNFGYPQWSYSITEIQYYRTAYAIDCH